MQIVKMGSHKLAAEFEKREFEESKTTFGCPRCRCVFTGYLMDPNDTMNMRFTRGEDGSEKIYAKCPYCEYDHAYPMTADELKDLRRPLDEIDMLNHPEWAGLRFAEEA